MTEGQFKVLVAFFVEGTTALLKYRLRGVDLQDTRHETVQRTQEANSGQRMERVERSGTEMNTGAGKYE